MATARKSQSELAEQLDELWNLVEQLGDLSERLQTAADRAVASIEGGSGGSPEGVER
jgi:hypothetical protein